MALRVPSCMVLAAMVFSLLSPGTARAHWCDDLWASSYNIVVKPASDTVNVPADGTATLDLFVQNNMGYPLKDFKFEASAPGYTMSAVRTVPTVANYLMPGEQLKYTLTISRTDGAAALSVESLDFFVRFGDPLNSTEFESRLYEDENPVMLKKADGGLFPESIGEFPSNGQAAYLQNSARADYLDSPDTGLNGLLDEFNCLVSDPTDYTYEHIWAAVGLAIRKSVLDEDQLSTLRSQLMCGWDDAHLTYKALAAVVLGYLPNADVFSFFQGIIAAGGDPDTEAIAKVALFLSDGSSYREDIRGICASSLGEQAQIAAAAALGIVDQDDAIVETDLIVRARWLEPDPDDGVGLLAAHLLDLVAWDRRGWAPRADYSDEPVSFFPMSGSEELGSWGGGSSGGGGGGGSGTAQASSGCGYGTGATSLLTLVLLLAARRRRT